MILNFFWIIFDFEFIKYLEMAKQKRYIIVYIKPGQKPETFSTLTLFCKTKNAPYWQLMAKKFPYDYDGGTLYKVEQNTGKA